jgi:hypothetical protein
VAVRDFAERSAGGLGGSTDSTKTHLPRARLSAGCRGTPSKNALDDLSKTDQLIHDRSNQEASGKNVEKQSLLDRFSLKLRQNAEFKTIKLLQAMQGIDNPSKAKQ